MSINSLIPENITLSTTSVHLEESKVSPFESLPYDILCNIQKYLNPSDTQAIIETSTSMNWSMLCAANVNSVFLLKSFIVTLANNLNPEISLNQINALDAIRESICNQGFSNLIDIKNETIRVKNQIIDVLITLDPEELKSLKKYAPPNFCEHLFQVAEICQLLPRSEALADPIASCGFLLKVFQALTQLQALDRPEATIAINRAIVITNAIPDQREKSITLSLIYPVLFKAQKPEANPMINEAIQIAKNLPDTEDREEALKHCSLALCNTKEFERAIEIAREIPSPTIQSILLSTIFTPLRQSGETERARAIMNESIALAKSDPDGDDFENALSECSLALCSVHEFEEAIAVTSEIGNPITRSSILAKIFVPLAQSGAIERSDEIINLAIELSNTAADDWEKGWILNRCIKSFLELGQIEKACPIARSIGEPEMHRRGLKRCSKSLLKAGKPHEAYLIAKEIDDIDLRGAICFDCSLALTKEGNLDEAYEAAKEILDDNLKDEALGLIIDQCFQVNEFAIAAAVASTLINPQIRDETLLSCSIELTQIGQFSPAFKNANLIENAEMKGEALKIYSKALINLGELDLGHEIGESIFNEQKRGEIFHYCSLEFIKAGRSIQGIEIAKSIPNEYLRWDALRDCSFTLVDTGELDLALEVAKSIPKDLRSPPLLKIALAQTQSGELETALKIAVTIPDLYLKGCALLEIVNSHLKAKNLARAGEIGGAIDHSEIRGVALMNYTAVLAAAGRFIEAIEVTQKILNDQTRSRALITLVQFYIMAERLDEALPIASDIPDIEERDFALNLIVQAHALAQKFDTAISISNLMKRKMTRFKVHGEIALSQAQFGQFDSGIALAHTLPNSIKWKTLSEIIKLATRNGEITLASNLVNRIQHHAMRRTTLYAMVTILSSLNKKDLAIQHAYMIEDPYLRDRALRYIKEIAHLDLDESGEEISISPFEEPD